MQSTMTGGCAPWPAGNQDILAPRAADGFVASTDVDVVAGVTELLDGVT